MIFKICLGECLEVFIPTVLQMGVAHLQAQGDLKVMQIRREKKWFNMQTFSTALCTRTAPKTSHSSRNTLTWLVFQFPT